MMPLRVLITNLTLAGRTGTELYVRDLALGLARRGHDPIVYTPDPGPIAEELRRRGVAVVDDLDGLGVRPDIIHGHHHYEVVTALCRFADVPAVFVCHDRDSWFDAPPALPRIRRYLAVDDCCRQRLVYEHAVGGDRVAVLLNAVDLDRFRRRGPLPARPGRAVVFSNYAREDGSLAVLRAACTARGIALDVVGAGVGRACERPEEILGGYDLVFAKGRSALEALACGAAVILYGQDRMGPLVRSAGLERLRRLNLGRRALDRAVALDEVQRQIDGYHAGDAALVTTTVRNSASLEGLLDALLGVYREVVDEHRGTGPATDEESAALARYLRQLCPGQRLAQSHQRAEAAGRRADQFSDELSRLRAHVQRQDDLITALRGLLAQANLDGERARGELAGLRVHVDHLQRCLTQTQAEGERTRQQLHEEQAQLERLRGLPVVRLRRWLGRGVLALGLRRRAT